MFFFIFFSLTTLYDTDLRIFWFTCANSLLESLFVAWIIKSHTQGRHTLGFVFLELLSYWPSLSSGRKGSWNQFASHRQLCYCSTGWTSSVNEEAGLFLSSTLSLATIFVGQYASCFSRLPDTFFFCSRKRPTQLCPF